MFPLKYIRPSIIICFVLFCNYSESQNTKLIKGDCIEDDETKPHIMNFIGADSSGIYFYKRSSVGKGLKNYIDKYDSQTLKLVYRCLLPNVFNNNALDSQTRRSFYMLKNGCIYILAATIVERDIEFYGLKIDKSGIPYSQFDKLESISYKNKFELRDIAMFISPNNDFFSVQNYVETKNAKEIINFKLVYGNGLKMEKTFDYTHENENCANATGLSFINNYGALHFYGSSNEMPILTAVNASKRLFCKPMKDVINNDSLQHMAPLNFYLRSGSIKKDLVNDKEDLIAVCNKRLKTYGFATLNYNLLTNEFKKGNIYYLDKTNTERLKDKISLLKYDTDDFSLKQSLIIKDHYYKIISKCYNVCGPGVCADVQHYLVVLIFTKEDKYIGQKLIPFHLSQFTVFDKAGDAVNRAIDKNYGTIVHNGNLYLMTNEDYSNENWDVNQGLIKDFNVCKATHKSNFCVYRISGNNPVERKIVEKEEGWGVFNIVNNFTIPGNYQYVYITIDRKRWLGKVIIE